MKKLIATILAAATVISTAALQMPVSADPLNEGIYNFVCAEGGRYLNVYAGNDWDGVNVCVWERDGSPEQNFKMVDRGGNRYVLYPTSSNGRVLDANRGNSYNNPLQAGNNIDIWQTNDAPAQEWYIDDRGGGKYTIELVHARGLVVSCDNPGANGGNCSLQSYNGSNNQLWYLQRADGGTVKPDSSPAQVITPMPATPAPVQPASSYRTGIYSIKYQGTNLRSGPGLENNVVAVVNAGTELAVTEVSGEWGKTSYNGATCWIRLNGFADFVREASAAPAVPEPETTRTAYVANTGGIVLRVRAQANTNCEILGTIKEGSSITVKGDSKTNGFWKVDYNGRTGYCHGDYISFSKPSENSTSNSSSFAYPVNANVTCHFGGYAGHIGTDFGVSMGTSVKASKSGTVSVAASPCPHNFPKDYNCGCSGGWGNYIRINHGDGTETIYAHLTSLSVSVGQRVSQGQEIGKSGSTGWSTGPHLHFEIRVNGVSKNAMNYLK